MGLHRVVTLGLVVTCSSACALALDGLGPDAGAMSDGGLTRDGGPAPDGGGAFDGGGPRDGGPRTDGGNPDAATPSSGDALAAGEAHSCASVDGELRCWGNNARGELGLGDVTSRDTATLLMISMPTIEVCAGQRHGCAVTADGSLYCWGANESGQLGLGDTMDRDRPQRVDEPPAWRGLTCGYTHTCALRGTGELWCWGHNREGQLAQPFSGGTGPDELTPVRSGMLSDWVQVDGGDGHSCGIRADGTLWCWGRNSDNQLGQGPGAPGQLRDPTQVGTETDWREVRVDQNHSCGTRAGGTLWCWGAGAEGRLGQPTLDDHPSPVRVGTLDGFEHVATGGFHGCAIRSGELYCWGRNIEGQLGLDDTADHLGPQLVGAGWVDVALGRFHSCATSTAGVPHCTGANPSGQLGVGDTSRRRVFTAVVTR